MIHGNVPESTDHPVAPGATARAVPFGASHETDAPIPTSTARRVRRLAALAAVLLVVVVTMAVVSAHGPTTNRYRTATVARHPITQQWQGVATIEPATQASVAFPIAGTVANVNVTPGQAVAVGQILATLDTTALHRSLDSAQSSATQANLNLQRTIDGQSTSSGRSSGFADNSTGGSATSASAGFTPTAFQPSTTDPTTSVPGGRHSADQTSGGGRTDLQSLMQQLIHAQQASDVALGRSENALTQANRICAIETNEDGPVDPSSDAPTTTTALPERPTAPSSCQAALEAVLTAQQSVETAQDALKTAAEQFDTAVAAEPSVTAPAASTGGGSESGSTTVREAPKQPESTSPPSATTLMAAQQAVDAANSAVTVARQDIDQASIVSPIAGRVASVGITTGATVTAASSSEAVTIVGSGGLEATSMVPVSEIPHLRVGMASTVIPDGHAATLHGRVVAISLDGTTGTSGVTSYPVTIGLTGDTEVLGNGSTASVAIQTGATRSSIAVPTSAISTRGSRHLVTALDHGSTKLVPVEVGVVGASWTQVTSGLSVGEVVVVADLEQPLPGSVAATPTSGEGRPGTGQRLGTRGVVSTR